MAFRYFKKHWAIPEAVPLVVPISAAVMFGLYSGYRHLHSNPDIKLVGREGDQTTRADRENEGASYLTKRLERGRKWVHGAHGSDFELNSQTNTAWTKDLRQKEAAH
mmetsp:Transcript_15491/g.49460  ORF Transcript_15491/g.49460 Transcript_15491/m.49460 type:complete len:107 (-) Transcript_15491:1996-2316(-)